MKKKLNYAFVIVLVLTIPLNIFAQSNKQLTDEQKKAQLKNKLAELNQQELLELEKQVELKTREVNVLQTANTVLENKINKVELEKTTSVKSSEQKNVEVVINQKDLQTKNSLESNVSFASQNEVSITAQNSRVISSNLAGKTNSTSKQDKITVNCENSPTRTSRIDIQICAWAKDAVKNFNRDKTQPLELDVRPDVIAPVFVGKLFQAKKIPLDNIVRDFLIKVEDSRLDKQVGADSTSSGTTSLAVKGGVPAFLNWAVENGAASSTSSGTTTTFRINPVGFVEAITGQAPVTIEPAYTPNSFFAHLKRTSIGLSFDISRGATPNVFTGNKQQLSAISFRYELLNRRNGYKEALKKFFDSTLVDTYADAQIKTTNDFLFTKQDKDGNIKLKSTSAQDWYAALNKKLEDKSITPTFSQKSMDEQLVEVETEIKAALNIFPVNEVTTDKEFIKGLTDYVTTAQAYVAETDKLLKAARRGTVFTFEYTNNREIKTSDTSNLRLIYERNTFFDMDLTLNASLSFFHKKPISTDVKRLKDFNFALQLDKPFSFTGKGDKNALLTFAGKYQRLDGDAVALDGTVLPNTKGDIAVGQIKLMIPIYKGIRFPVSATFANRTELVREKEVRGNFGLTFDIDTLLTIIRKP